MKRSRMSRREFLGAAAGVSVAGAGGWGLYQWLDGSETFLPPDRKEFVPLQLVNSYTSALLRPPGALKEKQLVSKCIKCMKCGQACPVGAVRFLGIRWGRSFGTPVVVPGIRACDVCVQRKRKECIAACPTGALTAVADDNDIEMGKAKVDEDLCFEHQDERICSLCHKVCPVRAKVKTPIDPLTPRMLYDKDYREDFLTDEEFRTLTKTVIHRAIEKDMDDKPTVTEDRCIGCGKCEEICPQLEKAVRVEAREAILI